MGTDSLLLPPVDTRGTAGRSESVNSFQAVSQLSAKACLCLVVGRQRDGKTVSDGHNKVADWLLVSCLPEENRRCCLCEMSAFLSLQSCTQLQHVA